MGVKPLPTGHGPGLEGSGGRGGRERGVLFGVDSLAPPHARAGLVGPLLRGARCGGCSSVRSSDCASAQSLAGDVPLWIARVGALSPFAAA